MRSIERFLGPFFALEVFVVDNGSAPSQRAMLRNVTLPAYVSLIFSEKNLGFGAGNNLAQNRVTGNYVVYLNNDTLFIDDSIRYGIALLDQDARTGMVGAMLLHEDKTPNVSYGHFPFLPVCIIEFFRQLPFAFFKRSRTVIPGPDSSKPFPIDFPCGAFMLLRRSEFNALKGFDERFFMYYEEADLAYRLKRHLRMRIVCHPQIKVIHKTGSTVALAAAENRMHFYQSWRAFILKHQGRIRLFFLKRVLRATLAKEYLVNRVKSRPQIALRIKQEAGYVRKYL